MPSTDNSGFATTPEQEFLPTRKVRVRYGDVSEVTIDRWVSDPSLGFPKPIYIGRMRYWRIKDLETFERRRPTENKPKRKSKSAE